MALKVVSTFILDITSPPGPIAAREKIITFFVYQSFFSSGLFMFWSLRYPGVRGSGWQGQTCVKNLS